jgi:hypothetical protein
MANSKIIPIADAIKDAQKMIQSNTLPTHKDLAKKWHCSLPRVAYVLGKIKSGTTNKKPGRPKSSVSTGAYSKHPILSGLRATIDQLENDLVNAEGYVSAIPGLSEIELNKLVKKAQASVWAEFHKSASKHLESIQKLSKGRKKRSPNKVKQSKQIKHVKAKTKKTSPINDQKSDISESV